MNVLLTLPSLRDPGGVAGYYRAVLPALEADGTVIRTLEIGGTHGSLGFLHPLRDQAALSATIRHEPFDVVHVNPSLDWKSFIRDGLFVRQAVRKRLPVVVFFHGWRTAFEHAVERHLCGFFRATYAKAGSFIVLSSAFADKLRQWGVTAPIHVTTTAIPDNLAAGFSVDRQIDSIGSESPVRILFLARLERAKGIFETIDAVNLLIRRGLDVRLDIAGDGSATEAVSARLAELGPVADRFRLLGYVRGEQKEQVLASHQIYCLPSLTEGMPVSVLEAMAFGLVVVTRPVGGLKDFFQDGRMGYCTTASDADTLADLLQRLVCDRAAMAAMARFNAAYVREHCLASSAALRMRQVYDETHRRSARAS